MTFESLLASYPSATIVDPGTETVTGGLLGTTPTTVATDVDVWIRDLRGDDVETDPAAGGRIDARLLTTRQLSVGWEVRLDDGRTYVIVNRAAHRHTSRGLHHYAYDARRQ